MLHLADIESLDKPLIYVVMDTEEEFDWTAPFGRDNISVESIHDLHRGHTIFRKYGIKPAYLVDYPIINNEYARQILRSWAKNDECLVGAQLHPWVTPPHEEVVCPFNSYPCNLDEDLEKRKLEFLTNRISDVVEIRPQVYKAGRYGIDIHRESTLYELGYQVDTSVVPFRSYAGRGGGPDFFGLPDRPFWSEALGRVLFLPLSQTLVGPLNGMARDGLDRRIFGSIATRFHIPGILSRLGLLERIMLSPEAARLDDLRRLLDFMIGHGHKVLCLSLHSPTLTPGCTPYTKDEEGVERFLDTIDQLLHYFFSEHGGRATTPIELFELLGGQAAPAIAAQ